MGPRYQLNPVGAPPLPLTPGEKFTIGRSTDCGLSIPSQRVSRNHAEIVWDDDKPVLRDLGSQNGTHVNGRRIRGEHALVDGDELEFGPFLCTYRRFGGADEVQGAVDAMADTNAMTKQMVGDAMAGRLDQVALAELLQTLGLNAKTGTLEVFGPDGEGLIVVQEGHITFARTDAQVGVEAIFEMLRFSGQFSFSSAISESERNVNATMDGILMEAMRRLDEGQG